MPDLANCTEISNFTSRVRQDIAIGLLLSARSKLLLELVRCRLLPWWSCRILDHENIDLSLAATCMSFDPT